MDQLPETAALSQVPTPATSQVPKVSRLGCAFTALVTALLLFFSLRGAKGQAKFMETHGRLALYTSTLVFEIVLLLLVVLGVRLEKLSLREIIGGRWQTFEDFLLDVAIAIGFWIGSLIVLGILKLVVGRALGVTQASQAEQAKQLAGLLAPHGRSEIILFIGLSITAGFVEELLFRGYLQRQFSGITRNVWIGLIISSLLFGLGHGYQGPFLMLFIGAFGVMFGLLAIARRSLRPGMIAHGLNDAVQGLLLRFVEQAAKNGMLK